MPKIGRPRALDEHKLQVICGIVGQGGSLEVAAQMVGCALSTIHREKKRCEQFRQRLHDAQVEATLTPYRRMNAASRRSWRAAAWMIQENRSKLQHPTARDLEHSDALQRYSDRPVDPANAQSGALFFGRLAELMKAQGWGKNRLDGQVPRETPTSGMSEPFAPAE